MDVASSIEHVYDKEFELLGSEHASEENLHYEVGNSCGSIRIFFNKSLNYANLQKNKSNEVGCSL